MSVYDYIVKILGLNMEWPVVMVGAGRLGTALSMYGGFSKEVLRL